MKMSNTITEGFHVIHLTGQLDANSVVDIKDDLTHFANDSDKGIVINMVDISFIDSSGIGALVFLYKRLHAKNKSLYLAGLNNQPLKLIKLLRINQTIKIYNDISDIIILPPINGPQEA